MPADLPSTPSAAPPNFYSQVGSMAASGGGPGGGSAAGGSKPTSGPGTGTMDPDHDFLDTVNKLLNVLAKISDMKPRGQDITKYCQAAADAMKDCVKQVFADSDGSGDADAGAGSSAADVGPGSGAAVSPQLAM